MADSPKHGSHFAASSSTPKQTASVGRHSASGAAPSAYTTSGQGGSRFKTSANGTGAPAAGARTSQRLAQSNTSAGTTGMVSVATPRSRAQRQSDARGGHSAKGAIVGVIAGILVVALLAIFVAPRVMAGLSSVTKGADDVTTLENQGQQVSVIIPDGSGAYDVAALLKDGGLIVTQDGFVQTMMEEGADSKLKSGAYVFTIGQDYETIIAQLVEGSNSTANNFTIPEGSTLKATASIIEATLGISADEFINQAKASNYVNDYSFLSGVDTSTYDTLEGFLYPKTYDLSMETDLTADKVIRTMLDQFQTEIASLDFSYAEGRGLSVAQVVNLASIVEKESTQSTGAMVAAVFWNRLGNMGDPNYGFLQSDATTAYSVGHDPTAEEVHDENDPYSTYTNQGLPPTPICSPSLTSLQNVCSPDMDYINGGYYYFYFWNDENGEVQYAFSKTLDEHNAAIAAN